MERITVSGSEPQPKAVHTSCFSNREAREGKTVVVTNIRHDRFLQPGGGLSLQPANIRTRQHPHINRHPHGVSETTSNIRQNACTCHPRHQTIPPEHMPLPSRQNTCHYHPARTHATRHNQGATRPTLSWRRSPQALPCAPTRLQHPPQTSIRVVVSERRVAMAPSKQANKYAMQKRT
jgi:hypothetical protein